MAKSQGPRRKKTTRSTKKRSTNKTTTKRSPSKRSIKVRPDSSKNQDEEIIEFVPAEQERTLESRSHTFQRSAGGLEIPDNFYQGRNELLDWLGGKSALRGVRASAVASGQKFGLENILGVGIGVKESGGAVTGELAIKVFVKEKVSQRRVSRRSNIPDQIGGIPTDVTPTGILQSFSYAQKYERPVPSGVSCGHPDVSAGTIGCLVVLNNKRLAILSNNHVLANENRAKIGDPVIQPATVDHGTTEGDIIGQLEAFQSIDFQGENEVDAAVAWTSLKMVSKNHQTYSLNPNPVEASPLETVVKNGRTTQSTAGWIEAVDVDGIGVEYVNGVATFNNQIIIRSLNNAPFSQSGDSGSLVVTGSTKQPVGLLFAGSHSHSIANPISTVMNRLGIDRFYS